MLLFLREWFILFYFFWVLSNTILLLVCKYTVLMWFLFQVAAPVANILYSCDLSCRWQHQWQTYCTRVIYLAGGSTSGKHTVLVWSILQMAAPVANILYLCDLSSRWQHQWQTYHTRVAFQVFICPGSYQVGPETIGARKQLDPKFSNREIEWYTNQQGSTVLYGLLIKVEDSWEKHSGTLYGNRSILEHCVEDDD